MNFLMFWKELVELVDQLIKFVKEHCAMATDPAILADISDIEDALSTFTGSNDALPGLKSAVDQTTAAYNAGLAQAASDKSNLDAKVQKLISDVGVIESGGVLPPPVVPVPPAPPAPPAGGDTPPAGGSVSQVMQSSRFGTRR